MNRVKTRNKNRITERLGALKKQGRKALVTYLVAGDPDFGTSARLVTGLARSGVDVVELGVPFSDPLADGVTIQTASARALARGITLGRVLHLVQAIRKTSDVPIALMGYFNPIHSLGEESFFRRAREAGVDGVIVPDLPAGERRAFSSLAYRFGISPIFLVAPNTTEERIIRIARESRGFVYCVSIKGVTGARSRIPREIGTVVERIRRVSRLPVLVGFGVSGPDQARWVCSPRGGKADGVVVGSALVKLVEKHAGRKTLLPEVTRFTRSLRRALD